MCHLVQIRDWYSVECGEISAYIWRSVDFTKAHTTSYNYKYSSKLHDLTHVNVLSCPIGNHGSCCPIEMVMTTCLWASL
jgi:hypothetical protein